MPSTSSDLDQRRQDRVQRIADQRADRARAAFDVAREAAGLAVQMKAQAERMQVLEDLQCDGAHRALGDAGEKDLAQLGEQHGGKAQRAVGRQQAQRYQQHRLLQLAARQREAVDDVLEHHWHRDTGYLRQQQAGQREDNSSLPGPQVGQQGLDRLPVVAFFGDRPGQGHGGWGAAHHGRILVVARRSRRHRYNSANRLCTWGVK
jgi:hypothetical protein